MEGYIKIHRQITKWEWYDDANTFRLFIHLLIKANHADGNWRGNTIKRGQIFTSIGILSHELSISEKAIRIAIDKLIKTKEIVCKGASNGTMITICNYDTYQSNEETTGRAKGRTKGERKGKRGANEGRQTIIINNNKEGFEEEIKNTIFSFDEFWDLYGKKVGKTKAQALFEKTTEAERKLIKEFIPKYKISKPEVKYRKDPERFLKYKVWEDEIISDEIEDNKDKFFANGQWHKKTPMQKYH